MDSELTSLCQSVLEDFNLCLFYLPSSPNLSLASEDEEEYESGYAFLPDLLIFQMVIICLMGVHSLKRAGNSPSVPHFSQTGFWDPHYRFLQLLIRELASTSSPFTTCVAAWLWETGARNPALKKPLVNEQRQQHIPTPSALLHPQTHVPLARTQADTVVEMLS